MAIHCEFIDFVIPIENIEKVYPGGFEGYKKDHSKRFSGALWYDKFLLRDGAMSPMDIGYLVEEWEKLGLKGISEDDGEKKWKDFCVIESMFGGPTLKCDWIEFDKTEKCVWMKGTPKGEITGRQGSKSK